MFNFFKSKRGDELLKIEKSHENFDVTYVLGEVRRQGVIDENIRTWWNMSDEQHIELMQHCDNVKVAAFKALLDEGFSKKEAVLKLKKGYPIYEIYKAGIIHDMKDDSLPYELLPRVNKYFNSLAPDKLNSLKEDVNKLSSMNAYIRDLIDKKIIQEIDKKIINYQRFLESYKVGEVKILVNQPRAVRNIPLKYAIFYLMDILGWIIWIALLIINLGFLYALIQKRRKGGNIAPPTTIFLLGLWLILIYFLVNPQFNKLNMLIAIPGVILVCSIIAYSIGFFFRKPSQIIIRKYFKDFYTSWIKSLFIKV